jgi:very-short-patch-repair endonuclease
MRVLRRSAPNGNIVALVASRNGLWFSQRALSELFATTTQNISLHIAEIARRLDLDELRRRFSLEQKEGSRSVKRRVLHFAFEVPHLIAFRGQYWDEWNWLAEISREFGAARPMYRVLPVKEREFGELLEGILRGITPVEKQVPVAGFFIDFYLPEMRIAVEFDEKHHLGSSNARSDRDREQTIRQSLPGVEFIRVPERDVIEGLNKMIKRVFERKPKQ